MTRTTWARIAVAGLVGCAASASYIYAPDQASFLSDGYPAAMTPVPPELPQGKVEVTSFGIVEIKPDGAGALSALHVRLAISNDGDTAPWTVTTTDQLVEIAGEGQSRPMFVNTNVQALPTIAIGARERRVLDLYYPLPANISSDEELPAFDFLWRVTTAARPFASRTHFNRIEQEPSTVYTNVVLYSGWGPYWWYDPLYPGLVFVHHHPIYGYRPGHVIITRPPSWHYRAGGGRRR